MINNLTNVKPALQISILNTTEKSVKINTIKITLEALVKQEENAHILGIQSSDDISNIRPERLEKISQLIRTDHLNKEEKQSLLSISYEYSHIFLLMEIGCSPQTP